jgi:hypothetical protein
VLLTTAEAARHINWYIDSSRIADNAAFADAHADALTGFYLCCNSFNVDRTGKWVSALSDTQIKAQIAPMQQRGLDAYYVSGIEDAAISAGNWGASISAAVDTVVRNGFDGYIVDYEPSS